MDRRSQLINTC